MNMAFIQGGQLEKTLNFCVFNDHFSWGALTPPPANFLGEVDSGRGSRPEREIQIFFRPDQKLLHACPTSKKLLPLHS